MEELYEAESSGHIYFSASPLPLVGVKTTAIGTTLLSQLLILQTVLETCRVPGPMLGIGIVNQTGTVPQALSSLGKEAGPHLRDTIEIWTVRTEWSLGAWGQLYVADLIEAM